MQCTGNETFAIASGVFVMCACGLQVYTVGPDYAHAEARKSPALDGKVERDSEGKEIRYPVMLSAMEKLVARKVCLAFKVTYSLPGICCHVYKSSNTKEPKAV